MTTLIPLGQIHLLLALGFIISLPMITVIQAQAQAQAQEQFPICTPPEVLDPGTNECVGPPGGTQEQEQQQIQGESIPGKYLNVTSHTVTQNSGDGDVDSAGTVVNHSDKEVSFVWITVEYYDEDNNLITSNTDLASDVVLSPGESASFSFLSLLADSDIVDHYRILPGGQVS